MKDKREQLKRLEDTAYRRGWDEAVAAAVERLRNHRIDWLGDKSFGQMEAEILHQIESLSYDRLKQSYDRRKGKLG